MHMLPLRIDVLKAPFPKVLTACVKPRELVRFSSLSSALQVLATNAVVEPIQISPDRRAMKSAWLACALVTGAIASIAAGAAPVAQSGASTSEMVARIELVNDRLQQIEAAIALTVQRRTVALRVDSPNPDRVEMLPSRLLGRIGSVGAAPVGAAFRDLLDDAAAARAIGASYGCRGGAEEATPNTVAFSDQQRRAAHYLDTLVRVKIDSCVPPDGLPPYRPVNSQSSDTNSKAIHAEEVAKAAAALHRPVAISADERLAVMLGQGFRFAAVDDEKIPLASYLQQQVVAAAALIEQAMLKERPQAKHFRIVFDRRLTTDAGAMAAGPKGSFHAFTEPEQGIIYLSPTLARAALVSCVATTNFQQTASIRLIEVRNLLRRRALETTDASGTVRAAEQMAGKMDQCVIDEMRFVLAHELAQGMYGIASEAIADCVATAIGTMQRRPSLGVMGSMIFATASTQDYALLGGQAKDVPGLQCRARAQAALTIAPQLPFGETLKMCEAMKTNCP